MSAAVPDLTQRVLGWRAWRLVHRDPRLPYHFVGTAISPAALSVAGAETGFRLGPVGASAPPWTPGANRAQCYASRHYRNMLTPHDEPGSSPHLDAPYSRCGCGLYGWHDASLLDAGGFYPRFADGLVAGVIAAWGRMQVHPHGFRAQYAEPLALLGAGTADEWLKNLAAHYRVPIIHGAPNLRAWALERAAPVPESLRPEFEEGQFWVTGGTVHLSVNTARPTPPPPPKQEAAKQPSEPAAVRRARRKFTSMLPPRPDKDKP